MANCDICVILLCMGNQYKYLNYVIDSFANININKFYILHYDSFYQYRTLNTNVVNIDLENYEYNICKCFNTIRTDSNKWIIWDSTYFFNDNVKDKFNDLIKSIGTTYDIAYIYGINLCIDIYNQREDDIYTCKNGGCFITTSAQIFDENNYNFQIKKNGNNRIKYELDDRASYYFFNFAEAVEEELMLIKYFKMEYIKFMYENKTFLSFSHFYYNKTQTHIDSGSAYLFNKHAKIAKLHYLDLPSSIQSIYLYKFANGCRSKIFSKLQYHDYSITIVTLVRNNKHFLKESMGSLINQTSSNWNCIIVNDGSDYLVEHKDFLTKENVLFERHFKILNLPEWNGLVKCHKLALMHTTNEIVGVLDADDMLEPTAIEKVLSVYNGTKKDNIFVYTNFFICDENMKKKSLGFGNEIKTSLLSDRCGNHFRTFKTRYYYLTKGFDDDLQFGGEDQDILFKMEMVSQPIFLNDPLYLYRVPTNNSQTITSMKIITAYSLFISIFKNIYDRYKNLNFELNIHNKKNLFKSQYAYIKNIENLYLELSSNNIYIMDGSRILGFEKYLNLFKSTKQTKFDVEIRWNYYLKSFEYIDKPLLKDSNVKPSFPLKDFCKIHPAVYFNHVYILNLTQDVKKRERMESLFREMGIAVDFVEAVYGKSEPYLSEFNKHYTKTLRSAGAYGYSLTMLKIFDNAIANNYKKILVCDDDLIFHRNFLDEFDIAIRKVPFDWKVLFFGLSGPWSGVNVNQDIKVFNFNKSFIKNLVNCDGSFCMGYDISILATLKSVVSQFSAPFDTAIIKYFNDNNIKNIYAFYPYLVLADTTTSQIQFRESDTMENFIANQFRFRQNMDLFRLDTFANKNYDRFYNDPYPKVSLISIVENENMCLNIMLNSFIDQTYKNIELIVILTENISDTQYIYLTDYSDNHNIHIYKNVSKENSVAFALDIANGSTIGFVLCDSYLISTCVEKQVKHMNDTNTPIVGTNVIYTHLNSLSIVRDDMQILNRANQVIKNNKLNGFGISFGIHSLLFKKYLIKTETYNFDDQLSFFNSIFKTNGQHFDTNDELLSFLNNCQNELYSKIDEVLIISNGEDHPIIDVKELVENNISHAQQLKPLKKHFDDNASVQSKVSVSSKKNNVQSNYDIVMKLKFQNK